MKSNDYPIHTISLKDVKIKDNFWGPRIEINQKITIPYTFKKCEETGRIDNFSRAAGLLEDGKKPIYPFDDSDVFKIIEGASYSLMLNPDSKLEDYLDKLIEKIEAAQEEDGYLYTIRTITPVNPHEWSGNKRWELVSVLSHELYNLGHLIESGVAYYQATGKKKLLDVAIKAANLIDDNFGQGKIEDAPGHQEIEIALIKLFQGTNDYKFLKLAKFFLDIRCTSRIEKKLYDGKKAKAKSPQAANGLREYNQSHKSIIKQREAVGHAVRATYMYTAMTDIATYTGDTEYLKAVDQIWDDMISKKIYITGGIGATKTGEAFGRIYKLPNRTAYNETCAAIGNILWNHRLFLLHREAKYIDILERILYNGFLSGISLNGDSFFYPNPLASNGEISRMPWFDCACCPSNIVRLIPQISDYMYTYKKDIIYVNLFIGSNVKIPLKKATISLSQENNYPWDGDIKLTVNLEKSENFTIAVRIPGWAQNTPIPSDLYHYLEIKDLKINLKVNQEPVAIEVKKGFVMIKRLWTNNDTIELLLPMPIRRVISHEKIKADRGRVAIERGPIVYCIESIDNDSVNIFNYVLEDDSKLEAEYHNEMLNGIVMISGTALILKKNLINGKLVEEKRILHAIPYYGWANRELSEMNVWILRDKPQFN